ncbi:MAG: hypothetical protein ACYCPQ_07990 [Elusimicrobiota bacterium]
MIGALLALPLLAAPVFADVYMQVGSSSAGQNIIALAFPPFIAGSPFTPESAAAAKDVQDIVRDDLLFSRYFNLMSGGPNFSGSNLSQIVPEWKNRGSQRLLAVQVSRVKSDISALVRIIDVESGGTEFSRSYRQDARYPRSLAHRISDAVVYETTGKKGLAESQIAFADDRTGHREIYMADYDGYNLRQVTRDKSICLLPRFSPDKSLLVFTSYRYGNPDLFGLNLITGKRRVISADQGLNIAGGFSPDGRELLLTLSREKAPQIYVKDLAGGGLTRLTSGFGTHSSPTFSPDGAQAAFVSDVSGNPEIYLLDLTTLRSTRITSLAWCDSPSWSPDGQWIAFSGRANASDNLDIFLVDVTGTQVRRLTSGAGANENPAWSPDGRFIAFSSNREGRRRIFIMDADGSAPHPAVVIQGSSITPAWSN